jgi:hypothetical protein
MDQNSPNFSTQCSALYKQQNPSWYDAYITQDIVSTSDLCDALQQLYKELKSKNSTSIDKAVIYTYSLLF